MIARILFTILHALIWAILDSRTIQRGASVVHWKRWTIRAVVEVAASLVFVYIRKEPIDIRLVGMTLACGLLFSSVFRLMLNTMRGRDWRYVAPWSSFYDRVFYRVVFRRWYMPLEWLQEARHLYNSKETIVLETVHRAGLIAYASEVVGCAVLL